MTFVLEAFNVGSVTYSKALLVVFQRYCAAPSGKPRLTGKFFNTVGDSTHSNSALGAAVPDFT